MHKVCGLAQRCVSFARQLRALSAAPLAPRPRTAGVAAMAGENLTEEELRLLKARQARRDKTRTALAVVTRLGKGSRLVAALRKSVRDAKSSGCSADQLTVALQMLGGGAKRRPSHSTSPTKKALPALPAVLLEPTSHGVKIGNLWVVGAGWDASTASIIDASVTPSLAELVVPAACGMNPTGHVKLMPLVVGSADDTGADVDQSLNVVSGSWRRGTKGFARVLNITRNKRQAGPGMALLDTGPATVVVPLLQAWPAQSAATVPYHVAMRQLTQVPPEAAELRAAMMAASWAGSLATGTWQVSCQLRVRVTPGCLRYTNGNQCGVVLLEESEDRPKANTPQVVVADTTTAATPPSGVNSSRKLSPVAGHAFGRASQHQSGSGASLSSVVSADEQLLADFGAAT